MSNSEQVFYTEHGVKFHFSDAFPGKPEQCQGCALVKSATNEIGLRPEDGSELILVSNTNSSTHDDALRIYGVKGVSPSIELDVRVETDLDPSKRNKRMNPCSVCQGNHPIAGDHSAVTLVRFPQLYWPHCRARLS